jgi:hypothetical protein
MFLPSDNGWEDFANRAGSMARCIDNLWQGSALMSVRAVVMKPPDV